MGTVETRHNNINQKAQAVMKGNKMTNDKFIKSLSAAHPLAEIFIIDAIYKLAQVAAKERLPEDHIIHPDAWQQCAVNLKTIIQNRK